MKKPFAQIPFNPAKCPFFYGWFILFWGIIGILLSVPGQTTGVSAFIEPLIEDLGIGRFELSVAYMIGTFSSSFLLTPAGKLFDRIGARWMGFGSCLALGFVVLLLSQVDHLVQPLEKILPEQIGLVSLLAFLFLLLRLSGQGILTMSSRNMVMKWFDHHRGLTSGISGAAVTFGFSLTPSFFSGIIDHRGWSGTWFILGLLLIIVFAPLLLLFFRDTPETFGLIPDGKRHAPSHEESTIFRKQFTLPEARRSFAFWPFAMAMALQALVITAVTFHIESVFELGHMDGAKGFSIFPPMAYISIAVSLFCGWLGDRAELRWLLLTMLMAMAGNLIALLNLHEGGPIYAMIVFGGIANGLFGLLMSVTWPRYFGRDHLGAISGLCMTFMVIASSIGPVLYSQILKMTGSYDAGFILGLAGTLILIICAPFAKNPQKKR